MTDIINAQFADFPNRSGQTTFSYAELLAQLIIDLPFTPGANPNIGLGANATGANQDITSASSQPVVYDDSVFDDLGFLDIGGANPERFTIPVTDPQITRVIFGGGVTWETGAGGDVRGIQSRFNFSAAGNLHPTGASIFSQRGADPAFSNRQTMNCGVTPVVPGDIFTMNAFQDSGGDLEVIIPRAWIVVLR
jgi:hypothetical protein